MQESSPSKSVRVINPAVATTASSVQVSPSSFTSAELPAISLQPTRTEHLTALRGHAEQWLTQLREWAATEPPERRSLWRSYLSQAETVQRFVDEQAVDWAELPREVQLRELASRLKDRRSAQGWSRQELARRAQLSEATIKLIETARHPPSRATWLRLCSVPELQLSSAELVGSPGPRPSEATSASCWPLTDTDLAPNCRLSTAQEDAPLAQLQQLGQLLRGVGGYVEQTYAYLDHHSAVAYLAACRQSPLAMTQRLNWPVQQVAARVAADCGSFPLTLVALGPGDGSLELRLVQHLLTEQPRWPLDLILFDISLPLLNLAHRRATDALAAEPHTSVSSLHGNFHRLPLYPPLLQLVQRRERRRLYSAIGDTFASIESELRSIRDSLHAVTLPGDLLLIDFHLVSSLSPGSPLLLSQSQADWLAGPILRACPEVRSSDFQLHAPTSSSVPGSTTQAAVATVHVPHQQPRQFCMFEFKRYEPTQLAESFAALGWRLLWRWPAQVSQAAAGVVMLFRRQADANTP